IAAGYRVQDPADRDPEDKPVLDTIAAVSRLSTLRPDSEQRWRAGQVRFAGQWTTPDTVAVLVAAYPDTIAYQARREKCPDTAEAHFKLAQWCRSRGLIAEQRAHLLIAARLDPNDQRAHRALGLTLRNAVWRSQEEMGEGAGREGETKKGYQVWKARLLALRSQLADVDAIRRADAEREIGAIHDPVAVPALEEVLSQQGEGPALLVVRTL